MVKKYQHKKTESKSSNYNFKPTSSARNDPIWQEHGKERIDQQAKNKIYGHDKPTKRLVEETYKDARIEGARVRRTQEGRNRRKKRNKNEECKEVR